MTKKVAKRGKREHKSRPSSAGEHVASGISQDRQPSLPAGGSEVSEPRLKISLKIAPKYLWGIVGVLMLIHFLLVVTSVREKSPTYDEVGHLTSGYTYWLTGDYRMAHSSPPLAPLWAALPLAEPPVRLPAAGTKSWGESDIYGYGAQFFYGMGNDLLRILRRGRTMIALVSTVLGLVVFVWSLKIFGDLGGLVSLVAYAFSPNLLANAGLVTTDLMATAFFLFTVGSAWWLLHRVTPASFACGTLSFGGLFLSKHTAFLVLPVLFVMVIIRVLSKRPVHICILRKRGLAVTAAAKVRLLVVLLFGYLLVGYLVVWVGYGFRYASFKEYRPGVDRMHMPHVGEFGQDPWEGQYHGHPRVKTVVEFFRHRRLLPEAYLYSIALNVQVTSLRSAFLDGDYSLTGFRRFFPLAFLYKTPVPFLLLLLFALVASVAKWRVDARRCPGRSHPFLRQLLDGLYWTAPLWLLLIVYWSSAIPAKINIGHRHILPTYPPLLVLVGAVAGMPMHTSKIVKVSVLLLVALLIVESLRIYPHYLAYFNWIAGGPANGYKHLVDSSLDWGQDLLGLKKWLQRNAKGETVFLAYFGLAPPAYFDIDAYALPYENMGYKGPATIGLPKLTPGIYCISATELQQVYPPGLREWTAEKEEAYWELLPAMRQFEDLALKDRKGLEELVHRRGPAFSENFTWFQRLRFAKLCAYLRHRDADDNVGYSILIYRLNDQELRDALYSRNS